MRFPCDATFLAEARTLALRFTCADCVHVLPDGSCGDEWPNESHREPPRATNEEVIFCKEFELGA